MGRIIFLYFLQRKGWMGCKTKWTEGNEAFVKSLFEAAGKGDHFYWQYLEPLFFETLNEPRINSEEDCIIAKKNFGKVPFLNGGLFEKEEKHPDMLLISWDIFNHLFETLEAYNFTIHEDDPDFKEVAVDPEMLGHIFENLLEDNNDKGAFYTPKEIVHYMCQETLIQYLKTTLEQKSLWPNDEDEAVKLEAELQKFVKQKSASNIIEFDKSLATALKDVKICDPAIGSGAFPMGILVEIFQCVYALHNASPDVVGKIWDIGDDWNPGEVKLNIIQNSIYGVDIEKGAVDIARLRFWLSLVVDEEKPRALPNLDYKIVVGNSLVSKFEGEIIEIDWERKSSVGKAEIFVQNIQRLLKEIADKQKKFFKPENKEKKKLQLEIRNLKLELLINQLSFNKEKFLASHAEKGGFAPTAIDLRYNEELKQKKKNFESEIAKLQRLKQNKDEPFDHFDWKLDFPEVLNPYLVNGNAGFDIVIGNPPYGIGFEENEKKRLNLIYGHLLQRIPNSYLYFLGLGEGLLKNNGVMSLIIPNEFLFQIFAEKARIHFVKNEKLILALNLGDGVFKAVVPSCIVAMKKEVSLKDYSMVLKDLRNIKLINLEQELKAGFSEVTAARILETPGSVFSFDQVKSDLVNALFKKSTPLESYFEDIINGISTSFDSFYVIDENVASKLKLEEIHLKPVLKGGNIDRYYCPNNSGRVILYVDSSFEMEEAENIKNYLLSHKESLISKSVEKKNGIRDWHLLFRPRSREVFEKPKILLRQTGDHITAAFDEEGKFFCLDSINIGVVKIENKAFTKFFIALLNSLLFNFVYQEISQEAGRVLAQVKPKRIKQLPVVLPESLILFDEKIDSITAYKRSNPKSDTLDLEKELDVIIFKLYGLTYNEVLVVEPSFWLSEFDYNSVRS